MGSSDPEVIWNALWMWIISVQGVRINWEIIWMQESFLAAWRLKLNLNTFKTPFYSMNHVKMMSSTHQHLPVKLSATNKYSVTKYSTSNTYWMYARTQHILRVRVEPVETDRYRLSFNPVRNWKKIIFKNIQMCYKLYHPWLSDSYMAGPSPAASQWLCQELCSNLITDHLTLPQQSLKTVYSCDQSQQYCGLLLDFLGPRCSLSPRKTDINKRGLHNITLTLNTCPAKAVAG